MKCPGCGRAVEDGAVICAASDFILDASFLGDDILNEAPSAEEVAARYGGAAMIVGELDDDGGYDSLLTDTLPRLDPQPTALEPEERGGRRAYGQAGRPLNRQSPFYVGFVGAVGVLGWAWSVGRHLGGG